MSDVFKLDVPLPVVDELQKLLGTDTSGEVALTLVKLKRLECIETEDYGTDEPYLTIYADDALAGLNAGAGGALGTVLNLLPGVISGVVTPSTPESGVSFDDELDEGEDMPIGLIFPLLPGREIRAKLKEIDDPDADDHIASVAVSLNPQHPGFLEQRPYPLNIPHAPIRTIVLTGDDAYYEIPCEVIRITLNGVAPEEPAGPDIDLPGGGGISLGDFAKGLEGITGPVKGDAAAAEAEKALAQVRELTHQRIGLKGRKTRRLAVSGRRR
jgi:hypothetical protein